MYQFKVGDIVQLKSGGAPLTIVEHVSWSGFRLVCMSTGGLAQEVRCTKEAIRSYHGPLTPATRK